MVAIKKILKKTDRFRRKITRNFVGILSYSSKTQPYKLIDPKDIKKVLVCRPNHRLGNQLLITPLVQEINQIFPEAKIDLFLKGGLGKIIFENYPSVEKLIMLPKKHFKQLHKYIYCWISLKSRKYDLVINANSGSSSGRLSTRFARSKYCFQEEELNNVDLPKDYNHFAKKAIYQLREFLNKSGVTTTNNEIPSLDINLKETEKINGKNILKQITKNKKPVIGFYTYATLDKCFSTDFWKLFYQSLKENYSKKYEIIEVLPIENVSQIDFVAPNFYSTDIRELASMISNMDVFISGDCGMMHLASAAKIPVVGLFKFDNINMYKPYANKSVGISSENLNTEYILTQINNIIQ